MLKYYLQLGYIGHCEARRKQLLPTVYTFQGKTEKSETENTIKRISAQDTDVSNGKTDMPEICVDESIPALPRTDVEMFLQGLSQGM